MYQSIKTITIRIQEDIYYKFEINYIIEIIIISNMSHDGASTSKSAGINNAHVPPTEEMKSSDRKREASWPAVLFYIHLNILGLYGFMVLFTNTSLITVIFSEIKKF